MGTIPLPLHESRPILIGELGPELATVLQDPDVRVEYLEEPVECDWCGRLPEEDRETCPGCGHPVEARYRRDARLFKYGHALTTADIDRIRQTWRAPPPAPPPKAGALDAVFRRLGKRRR